MKVGIALIVLMGLVPFAEAAQGRGQPDPVDCAWGAGSYEQGCDSRDAMENSDIKKIIGIERQHENSLTSLVPNTPQLIRVSTNQHSLAHATHN